MGVIYTNFADDTQILIPITGDYTQNTHTINKVYAIIQNWMALNSLCLNGEKTEFLIVGSQKRISTLHPDYSHINIDGTQIPVLKQVKTLGPTGFPIFLCRYTLLGIGLDFPVSTAGTHRWLLGRISRFYCRYTPLAIGPDFPFLLQVHTPGYWARFPCFYCRYTSLGIGPDLPVSAAGTHLAFGPRFPVSTVGTHRWLFGRVSLFPLQVHTAGYWAGFPVSTAGTHHWVLGRISLFLLQVHTAGYLVGFPVSAAGTHRWLLGRISRFYCRYTPLAIRPDFPFLLQVHTAGYWAGFPVSTAGTHCWLLGRISRFYCRYTQLTIGLDFPVSTAGTHTWLLGPISLFLLQVHITGYWAGSPCFRCRYTPGFWASFPCFYNRYTPLAIRPSFPVSAAGTHRWL
ncbi:uncharacterized protein [Ambystoma mexicanum]|uniref:uncharacterized protein n=1 Tax=Ambystoma mexicanum TaxID=8296 RepID=UPI0037E95DDA